MSNYEDLEPGALLNMHAKSDIGIYSSEDLPKEAGCTYLSQVTSVPMPFK